MDSVEAVDSAEPVALEVAVDLEEEVDSVEVVALEAAAALALAPGIALESVEVSALAATGGTASSSPSPLSAAPSK